MCGESSDGRNEARHNVICPYCERDTLPDSRYCIFCGGELPGQDALKAASTITDTDWTLRFCLSCGTSLPGFAKYCNNCGADQRRPSAPPPGVREVDALTAQRHMMETVYILHHGMKPESLAAFSLFPSGWFNGGCDLQIRALAEAIYRDVPIRDTETWNKEKPSE